MEFPDELYRDVCCIKTLYSTEEGFFKEFVRTTLEKVDPEWIETVFKRQTSQRDKVAACYGEPAVWGAIQDVIGNTRKVYRKKCGETAKAARLEADLLCRTGDYRKAVMMYSQSIIRAPAAGEKSSEERCLPLAYRGRANALFHLRRYDECLTDLNAAMKEGFPNALKYQLFRQMGECYAGLLEWNKARISLRVALKLIDDQMLKLETTVVQGGTKADETKDALLKKMLDKEREEIRAIAADASRAEGEAASAPDLPATGYVGGPLPEVTGARSEQHPRASGLVTVRRTADAGRFAVAAGRIETGATLVVEEPQASCLVPRMLASHCLHCFARLRAPVPCKGCAGVAFCGLACRDAASSTYHRYECEFLGLFLGSGMSVVSLLALRMVTQESLDFFKRLRNKVEATGGDGDPPGRFSEREARYMRVYDLTTHSRLRTARDYFRRTLMAVFLVRCLKETDFFGPGAEGSDRRAFSEDEILAASVVLRHLELLQFNAHEIYETRVVRRGQTRDAKAVYVGVGVYPTVALFNHECAPSVTRYFNGKNIVIKAVRPLEKNEVLSENYGPHYAKKILYDRIRELTSRYWFRCECRACAEDWPTLDRLTDEDVRIRCKTPDCRGLFPRPRSSKVSETNPICQHCLRKSDVVETLRRKAQLEILFDEALGYMDARNCGKAVPLLTAYLDEMFRLVSPPCREIFLCQEALRTCYAQTGNVWVLDE